MPERVDIVVVPHHSGHPELVVEVKQAGDLNAAAMQLAEYMRRAGIPLGLVVAGTKLRLLRDNYRGSIDVVGDFEVKDLEGLRTPSRPGPLAGLEFEAAVQDWIESLAAPTVVAALPQPLRSAVEEHLVPVIETGIVRAAGPRAKRAG